MKTRIHINLNRQKQGLPGIVALFQKGQIVGYCESATVIDCSVWQNDKLAAFSRTPGNKRTVHIGVNGTLINVVGFVSLKGRELVVDNGTAPSHDRKASYSPLRCEQGFMVDGEVWNGGKACTVTDHGMTV